MNTEHRNKFSKRGQDGKQLTTKVHTCCYTTMASGPQYLFRGTSKSRALGGVRPAYPSLQVMRQSRGFFATCGEFLNARLTAPTSCGSMPLDPPRLLGSLPQLKEGIIHKGMNARRQGSWGVTLRSACHRWAELTFLHTGASSYFHIDCSRRELL